MARTGWKVAAAGLVLVLGSAACGGTAATETSRLEVVAAFYPLAEAARQVGGPIAVVRDLTPPGVEPHDLELRPSDVGRLRSADLILYLGHGFQPALEDAIGALPDTSVAVDLLEGISLRKGGEGEESDPHVWLDPQLMKQIVRRVAEQMSERLPAERTLFESRTTTYSTALDEVHRTFEETLRTCRRREIVTSHAAFGYLAARFDLEQIAISGLTPEAEPSPRRLQEVAQLAEQRKVTTIFFETLVSPRVAATIARVIGARTAVLNPIEGLTSEELSKGESYRTMMLANLNALAMGLGCNQT